MVTKDIAFAYKLYTHYLDTRSCDSSQPTSFHIHHAPPCIFRGGALSKLGTTSSALRRSAPFTECWSKISTCPRIFEGRGWDAARGWIYFWGGWLSCWFWDLIGSVRLVDAWVGIWAYRKLIPNICLGKCPMFRDSSTTETENGKSPSSKGPPEATDRWGASDSPAPRPPERIRFSRKRGGPEDPTFSFHGNWCFKTKSSGKMKLQTKSSQKLGWMKTLI